MISAWRAPFRSPWDGGSSSPRGQPDRRRILAARPRQGPGEHPQTEAEACRRTHEDARLGRLELRAGEAQRRDEQGHGEADAAQASGADQRGPRRALRELRETETYD